jgi:AraC-like DNA-binding protein
VRYEEARPSAQLRGCVECFWFLSDDAAPAPRETERIVPDGCSELILHVGEPFERVTARGFERQTGAFHVGQLPHFILLRPARRIDTIGVRFRPAGARRFFREPADRLAGQFIALEDLWGSDARRLLARLQEASGRAERLRIVENALLAAFRDDVPDAVVAETCEWILRNAGRVSVREAARNVRLSERSLERRFRNELGLAPKVFARIVRLQGVLRAVGRCEQPDWADIAADCSYFDQPHLIREFRALTGETPTEFVRNQGRLSLNFTDPARLGARLGG